MQEVPDQVRDGNVQAFPFTFTTAAGHWSGLNSRSLASGPGLPPLPKMTKPGGIAPPGSGLSVLGLTD